MASFEDDLASVGMEGLIEYATTFEDVAVVEVSRGDTHSMTISSRAPGGCELTIGNVQWLNVEVGGGVFELDWSAEHLGVAKQIIRAVVMGHVSETFGFHRSHVQVTLDDGIEYESTVYEGLLAGLVPQPGWRRWARHVQYESYGPPEPG